ncbi:hypothetical protein B0H14DRAFT_557631 [Mycena olivaceomarginata]|nr:hypothetical protein B0H14DRAFT_557631 [Mycena olivaceomarginata]
MPDNYSLRHHNIHILSDGPYEEPDAASTVDGQSTTSASRNDFGQVADNPRHPLSRIYMHWLLRNKKYKLSRRATYHSHDRAPKLGCRERLCTETTLAFSLRLHGTYESQLAAPYRRPVITRSTAAAPPTLALLLLWPIFLLLIFYHEQTRLWTF